MNKKILWGTVGALILTGGYYASAASSPLHYTDYGYVPVKVSTTTYAPGTPSQYEYPNSPYQIGGKLGPKSGQTWQQKFDAGTGTVNRTTTPASPSNHSNQTAVSGNTSTPQRTTAQATPSNTPTATPNTSSSPVITDWPLHGQIPAGWTGNAGWTNSIGGGQWINPSNTNQYLNITYIADPAFYGVEWQRDWANPGWFLASTTGGTTGWTFNTVSYWQADGPNIWAFIMPTYGPTNTTHAYGFVLEGQQYKGHNTITTISFNDAIPTAAGWRVLASWLPSTPQFIPSNNS